MAAKASALLRFTDREEECGRRIIDGEEWRLLARVGEEAGFRISWTEESCRNLADALPEAFFEIDTGEVWWKPSRPEVNCGA